MDDNAFYEAAKEGENITIDIPNRSIAIGGQAFLFTLSEMEYNLTLNNGITNSFKRYGRGIWETFTSGNKKSVSEVLQGVEEQKPDKGLEW
jgi:3-isopropylmalate dehydratase small subunit